MDWKKLGKTLLFPPVWLVLILTAISAAGLILVFLWGWDQTPLAYGLYGLSFYTLSALVCYFIWVFPGQYRRMRKKIYENPFGYRYMTDSIFHSRVSLDISLGINLLYVGVNLWSWYLSRSWWFVVLGVYYGIMAVMYFLLVRSVRKDIDILREWKRSRICAYILLLINLSLSGAVLMILYQHRGHDYPGILIYVMALYTFYSTVHAIIEILKNRAPESPVLFTAGIVSLSAALVSMLNLETAMFAQFGADLSRQDRDLMIILTGAGISATVVTLSIFLIAKATKEIRRDKYEK